tara:strand:- start:362 stop:538 length:177 start_codon:yes stop_codon:yes gene_type:complete
LGIQIVLGALFLAGGGYYFLRTLYKGDSSIDRAFIETLLGVMGILGGVILGLSAMRAF